MRPPCVRTFDGDTGEFSAGPLGSTRLIFTEKQKHPIQSLADLAPWTNAPLLPYDEAVEYVANACGIIDFSNGTVTVKLPEESVTHKSLPLAVQVLETLSRQGKRLKELRHEIVEIETRQKKLRETDFIS